jgi:hypothetical protein
MFSKNRANAGEFPNESAPIVIVVKLRTFVTLFVFCLGRADEAAQAGNRLASIRTATMKSN